jgi:8-oxo-dGTP diphosphatase
MRGFRHRSDAPMSESPPYTYAYPHPAVTTDIVVLTVSDGGAALLLIERGRDPFRGSWALPGGFLDMDEDLERCAARELAEETGLVDLQLIQFQAFGAVHRDPRERVISVAYLALVPHERLQPKAGDDAADARWFPLTALPALAFDHAEVIASARAYLIERIDCTELLFTLLPETFTLGDARRVYEALVDAKVDKRNFRERLLALHPIEATGELRRRRDRRPAKIYRRRKHLSASELAQ